MRSIVEHLVFQCLAAKASAVSAEVRDRTIYLPTLGVTLSVGAVGEPTETNVIGVDLVAEHDGLPTPVRFTAVGFGDDLKASAEAAEHVSPESWYPEDTISIRPSPSAVGDVYGMRPTFPKNSNRSPKATAHEPSS